MIDRYDHKAIEAKWQERWVVNKAYRTSTHPRKKRYVLDMFPYPSAAGLHVGHPEGYTATDIVVRKLRAEGYDVLHPMGWDAFGLPAENYAIKTGTPPQDTTRASIDRFREQIQSLGFSYDWDREVNTSDPQYYRWTQWLFLKLYEQGLAYQKEAPVNWCPTDQTVLANEQVANGACDRCGTTVEQRKLKQWFFKISSYADELVDELDDLDWPESLKAIQRNWIGRSKGAEIEFKLTTGESVTVFTTRPDTLYGVTYLVLAPDGDTTASLMTNAENQAALEEYCAAAMRRTELERKEGREKTGVRIAGVDAIHPITGSRLPVWIADYVLASYGTGAVMAVPAHDQRDYDFARQYELPSVVVIHSREDAMGVIEEDGTLVNSDSWNGLHSNHDCEKIIDDLVGRGVARRATQYRLRDWLVSRQRYWGAPIPVVHCHDCGAVPVDEKDLPIKLPTDVDFRPTGESPIVHSASFHDGALCPRCSQPARRESDTMDTFVDSSWYFFRYLSPQSVDAPFDAEEAQQWLPVDLYVGGAEHAVLHLLYARFITKVLADLGLSPVREPFAALRNQGLILGSDGQKMSKSKGNVVNPDDVVTRFGADTLRAYEMFMGPFEDAKPWNTESMMGVRRWLERVWRLQGRVSKDVSSTVAQQAVELAVGKVTADIDAMKFNTAVSALMIASNELASLEEVPVVSYHRYLQILAPFAPHLANELWERTGGEGLIEQYGWPVADESVLIATTQTIVVQVAGKVRANITVPVSLTEKEIIALAKADENVVKHLAGATVRTVYVPGRLVNFVITG
ncbi:MAG: leucine--tRNA ligase [Patescibacteria group bacterium]